MDSSSSTAADKNTPPPSMYSVQSHCYGSTYFSKTCPVNLNLVQVFVEPIPQLFAKLEKSIERWPNSTAVNLAISPDRETVETKAQMWCYGAAFESHRLGKDLPSWANQICSFNASHIGRHFKGQQGVPVEVTAVNLEELLRRTTGAGSLTNLQVGVTDFEPLQHWPGVTRLDKSSSLLPNQPEVPK